MTTPLKPDTCPICGSSLEHLKPGTEAVCSYCRKGSITQAACPDGHFICEACRGRDAGALVEEVALAGTEKNPFSLAELLMSHPSLPMLGCEHAVIAAGALAAAIRNSPYGVAGVQEVREVFRRTGLQPRECTACLTGVCSVAPALGACFSLFLQCRPGSDAEQKIVMEIVNRISSAMADLTGPGCCKAYVRSGLEQAVAAFGERFGIVLPGPVSPLVCRHQSLHPHGCREEKCPYFRKEKNAYEDSINLTRTVCHS